MQFYGYALVRLGSYLFLGLGLTSSRSEQVKISIDNIVDADLEMAALTGQVRGPSKSQEQRESQLS